MPNHHKRRRWRKSSLPSRPVKRRSHSIRTMRTSDKDPTPEKTRQEMSDMNHIIGTSGGLNEMTPEGRQFQNAFNSFVFVVGFIFVSFVIMWAIGC
jgi:hypothetical protein